MYIYAYYGTISEKDIFTRYTCGVTCKIKYVGPSKKVENMPETRITPI